MSGKKQRNRNKVATPLARDSILTETKPKKSTVAPLVWTGAAAVFIGFPMLRDITSDRMERNYYADQQSCQCDYGNKCNVENGKWFGPWYAVRAEDRKSDDPGPGNTCKPTPPRPITVSSIVRGEKPVNSEQNDYKDYRLMGIERGHRGGFGSNPQRVRTASS